MQLHPAVRTQRTSVPRFRPADSARTTIQVAATQPTPEREQALQSAADKKQYADSLLNAAKKDLEANQLESAYEKALLASKVDTCLELV